MVTDHGDDLVAMASKTGYEDMKGTTFPNRELTDGEVRSEIRSIKRNLVAIWCCSVIVNSPTGALINSSSSLLNEEGLGVASLAANGTAQFLTAAVLLSYSTKIWGVRKVITLTFWLPIIYILSYLYPSWATSLPSGFILGLAQGSLTSTFMYGNALAYYYARLTKGNADTPILMISAFLASQIGASSVLGNLLLFLIMNETEKKSDFVNSTFNATNNFCGANYCNEPISQLDTAQLPTPTIYYTMVGVFLALAVSGAILSLFIRDFSTEFGYTPRKKSEFLSIVKETWVLLKDRRGYLLISMTLFAGIQEAFIVSEYTQAYVSCVLGIPKVGLVISSYAGTQVILCLFQGYIIQYLDRIFVVILGWIVLIVSCVTVLLWQPSPDQEAVFFIVAIFWAFAACSLIPAAFGLYGVLFEDNIEGSLSLAAFWWSLGFTTAFLWSPYLCVFVKLYLTMAFGCVGLSSYLLVEFLTRKGLLKKKSESENK